MIGPNDTERRITAAWDADTADLRLRELFDFHPPVSGNLGPFEVAFAPMNHPVPTFAVRMTVGGQSLVYSGDTGECEALVALAEGADTLLAEATFGPRDPYVPNLHLTGAQAGQHAARAGVRRLIVTHIPPWALAGRGRGRGGSDVRRGGRRRFTRRRIRDLTVGARPQKGANPLVVSCRVNRRAFLLSLAAGIRCRGSAARARHGGGEEGQAASMQRPRRPSPSATRPPLERIQSGTPQLTQAMPDRDCCRGCPPWATRWRSRSTMA